MLQEAWGLLGGEHLGNARRVRTLGLGAAVREFNECAVPGLGGVWFGKQVLLATLGIVVAERARHAGAQVRNIEVANAIEALACFLAFQGNAWAQDPRLRGVQKLQARGGDLAFSKVKQRSFYVTQPMRMSTVQALPSLGFAASDGVRFNGFASTELGRAFVACACDGFRPSNRDLVDHLVKWVMAGEDRVPVQTWQLTLALNPTTPLPGAASRVLSEGLNRDDAMQSRRRSQVLAWVELLRQRAPNQLGWAQRPAGIEPSHWDDLASGAKFFAVRAASLEVLDAMEAAMAAKTGECVFALGTDSLPGTVIERLSLLRASATSYLAMGHPQRDAAAFSRECLRGDAEALGALVARDGAVLRLRGTEIRPGAAFSFAAAPPDAVADELGAPEVSRLGLPPDMSYRVGNLFLLNLDMRGQLQAWLDAERQGASA